ncbi:serine-rich adhesin for platelets [Polistes fuscatus]|uniref:serine-rich adhesin for platelets n=1 Tax=Polistes fuscatus TaxID=30207 RepID=UPI001CA9C34A|nr:serine-rich adhesin for platelets [Polistes fuscatus]
MFFIGKEAGRCTIDKTVTRYLRTRQGWQTFLTVLVILLTSVFSSSEASHLSRVTADALGDTAKLWDVSNASKNVEHKKDLPASPAELLKPDKFLFYTYNDQGNMITKQMSLREIQALIAGGNGGHVTMEMYEPQKSADLLNGEKNVMDVVEKVQNVLKSALDKPSTMAGSLSSIPEYANAEWSSILPGILTNSEVEPDPTSEEPNYAEVTQPDSLMNTQKISSVSFNQESQSSTLKSPIIENTENTAEESINEATSTSSTFLLTSVIDNNKLSTIISYGETKSPDEYTEKPMIPVPVITTEGQLFTDRLETIKDSMYQTPTTKSTVEFIDIDHSAMNEMNNATVFEKVPVKVWDELEQNVTSDESSTSRVTEYVPILTMLVGSTVNDSSLALATNELVSSTEKDITKKVTEIMSVETSTVQTSIKINQAESITKLSGDRITEMVTPTIKTHVVQMESSSEHLSNANITTESFDEINMTIPEISKVTTPQVLSVISTSGLLPTKVANDEQLKTSQSFNLTTNATQANSYSSTSTPPDDYFKVSSSVNSSDDISEGTSISTITTDSESFSNKQSDHTIATITENTIFNSETNFKPVDNSTSNVDTNKHDEHAESLINNNLESLESNKKEDSPIVEEQSTLIETEISKINDMSTVQPTVANNAEDSTSTTTYTTEINFVRMNDSSIDPSILSSITSEFSTVTETTFINNLTSNISTESNAYVSNTTVESSLEKIMNDTEEMLITNTTVIPVLSTNETNLINNHIEGFIKDLSSPSTSQYTITTPSTVSNEFVTVTDSIKSSDTSTTIAVIKNTTMSSQIETLYTTAINGIITDNVQTTESYSNSETSLNPNLDIINKEPSFVRHQNDVMESLNSITTLEPLEQETATEKTITNVTVETRTTMLSPSTERITVEEYVPTLIPGELPSTETILKMQGNTMINHTNIELESSLKTNESRYSDSKEEISTLKPSTSYVKLNITFMDNLSSNDATNVSVENLVTTKITEKTTELFVESTPSSITTESFKDLFIQTNKTIEESVDNNITISQSNMMDRVTVNDSINIKSNQTNGTSLELIDDKTRVKVASNDSISVTPSVIEEVSSTKLMTPSVSTVTENSLGLKLTSKLSYNEKLNESYSEDKQTTEKWMLIPHKVVASSTEKTNIYPTNLKIVPQNITSDGRLPTVTSEIKTNERIPLDSPASVNALDVTVTKTENDIVNFSKMCNNLAFDFWMAANKGLSTNRSLVLSPFGMVSLLAMIFLGARGTTSDQMNELLKLDDVATFNPHLVFQNVTDMVGLTRGQGITNTAFVRELFVDRAKVRKTLPFYKEQAQQFYEGLVAEVNFATIGDIVRRRTNLLVRKQTGGRIKDFIKVNTVPLRSPLAAVSANVFQTNCNSSFVSSDGRDGELYFAVSPAIRQRKLIPVPAIVWRSNILAGYEPSLDATAVALGKVENLVTTVFLLPGQQGHIAPGDTLDRLERRLIASTSRDNNWNRLLKVLLPRNSLELQIPKFTHRSVVNATAALRRMGFDRLFTEQADLKGINGIGNHLHLSDILQINLFGTCGDENPTNGRHHMETYPATPIKRARQHDEEISVNSDKMSLDMRREPNLLDFLEANASTFEETITMNSKIDKRRKRHADNAKVTMRSERPRLKLDRPFLYFVRHNPTGLILHMGRFNPRLLP